MMNLQRHIEETLGVPESGPLRTTIYAHTDKDSMFEKGEKLGLRGEALSNFAYTAAEVELTVLVDRESGRALTVLFNGTYVASTDAIGGIPT